MGSCAEVAPLDLTFRAEPLCLRGALREAWVYLEAHGMARPAREDAALALAEICNNICEHAYGPSGGEIALRLGRDGQGFWAKITDAGRALPAGCLVERAVMRPEGDLAEGGYGWGMIRALVQDLEYQRKGGRNVLWFRL